MATNTLTPKQEAFCLAYIETGNASEAYRLNYNAENQKPETINRNAKKLMDNNKIVARLGELQTAHAARHNVTVDCLTTELIADRALARANKQSGAAITATMSIAKLHGLDVNRAKIETSVNVHGKFLSVIAERRKQLAVNKKPQKA